MKNTLTSVLLMLTISTFAQTGIGTTTPHASAQLEVASTNKGFLPPRVALTGSTSVSPLAAHVAGMLVYNTTTVSDVTPGLYVNNSTAWVSLQTQLIASPNRLENGLVRIPMPIGGSYAASEVKTGAIEIKLPSTGMVKFEVDVATSGFGINFKVVISGYPNSANGWGNSQATIISSGSRFVDNNYGVRFYVDGGVHYVYIGELVTSWGYPRISISNFTNSDINTSVDSWDDGWGVDIVTSFKGTEEFSSFTNLPIAQ